MRRRQAIQLLFAQWKKEKYERHGDVVAIIRDGIFPSDNMYEVMIFPKPPRKTIPR